MLQKTLESPLDCKKIKPVNPKGNQPWIFIGRTDAEAPILWSPDVRSQLTGKDPDAGKDWGQEKGATEDEMVWWHHRFNGHGLGQTPGNGEGQVSLVCCSPWGHKELDTTWQLNKTTTISGLVWAASTSVTLSGSRVHPAAGVRASFLWFCCWAMFHCIYVLHLFIHPSVDRCLGCFHFLETFHSTKNDSEQVFVWTCIFLPCHFFLH